MKIKWFQFGGLLILSLLMFISSANAVCDKGGVLIGEDEKYYYCSDPVKKSQIKGIVKDLDKRIEEGPSQWLGEEWKYRRAVISAAKCMVDNKWPYTDKNGKFRLPEQCTQLITHSVDCSGATEYSNRIAACSINGFYKACFGIMKGLETNADGQARYFIKNEAFIPNWGFPAPGDSIFFEKTVIEKDGTYKKGVTHTAIFISRRMDGKFFIMNPSANNGRMILTLMDDYLRSRVVGYGNISKLYMNVKYNKVKH